MQKVGSLCENLVKFETGLESLNSVVVAVRVTLVVEQTVHRLLVLSLLLFQVGDDSLWIKGFWLSFCELLLCFVSSGVLNR